MQCVMFKSHPGYQFDDITIDFLYAGAQIIDFMILVVDIMKGIQTQTAEVTYV